MRAPSPSGSQGKLKREKYMCPVCNMGSGHQTRTYNRHSVGNRSSRNGSSSSCASSPSSDVSRAYAREFQLASAFDRHIVEMHERMFQRTNSTEFVCGFCWCDSIGIKAPDCAARFSADPYGKKDFLDHLRLFHARNPDILTWHQHTCSPTTTASYTDPLVRRMAKSFSQTLDDA